MTPLDIACRHQNADLTNCGAEGREPCNWTGWQFATPHPEFHSERVLDAAGMGDGSGTEPSKEEFDKAVWGSGLL